MYNDDDYYDEPEMVVTAEQVAWIALPSATAVTGLLVGLMLGGVFGWSMAPASIETTVRADVADLGALCHDVIEDTQTQLDSANRKVATLQDRVSAGEAKLAELQDKMKRRGKGSSAVSRELAAVREELAQTKLLLVAAEADKERLIVELTETEDKLVRTEAKLERQVRATKHAEEDALVAKWYRFLDESQLRVCEKGNRKRLGNCRERVLDILGRPKIRDKFSHCVRSGQAVPEVEELGRDEQLPSYSYYLNRDDRFVKGWYLHLCDPSLPEKPGYDADPYDDGGLPTGFEFEDDEFAGLLDGY